MYVFEYVIFFRRKSTRRFVNFPKLVKHKKGNIRRVVYFGMTENTEETTRRCTNCSRGPQPLCEFASAKDASVLVKRCAKCRAKDDKRKRKPDVRDKSNARGREKKYYVKYVEKRRSEDPEAYRAYRAGCSATFREKNPEYMGAFKKNTISYRVSIVKTSAKKRDIVVDMTDDEIAAIVCGDCAYCGKTSEVGDFNGADRMDSTLAYTPPNVVSCCFSCNVMKVSLDPVTFVNRCKHIAGLEEIPSAWPLSGPGATFYCYKWWAAKKNLPFTVGEEEFEALRHGACRYCRREPRGGERFGVDRLDSSGGYVDGNCVTACSECNYMKKDLGEAEFAEKCAAVAAAASEAVRAYAGPRCLQSIVKRVTKDLVEER